MGGAGMANDETLNQWGIESLIHCMRGARRGLTSRPVKRGVGLVEGGFLFDAFDDFVGFVADDDAGGVVGDFVGGDGDKGEDDDAVADVGEAGGGAVDADDAGAGGTGDDVGFEAVAIFAIGDKDLFVGKQAGGTEEVGIDGDGAVVVQVGLGDDGLVDLGLEQLDVDGGLLKRKAGLPRGQ